MWIGIGCGALLLIGALGAAGVYYAYSSAAEKLEEAAKSATGTGGTSSAAATGGGACPKAAACCQAIVEKSGADKNALAACDNFRNASVPELACNQALETYKKTAPMLGVKCE